MARRDALQRIRDEIARAALRLGPRLLLEHAHAPSEIMLHELLPTLEQVRLGLLERHTGDPLELGLLRRLHLLQLLLQLAEMRLAVGEPLILAPELDQLPLDLLLLREHALLDLQHRLTAVGELGIDLGAQLHRLLARFDLRLATHGLSLALGVLDQLPADAPRLADARCTEDLHGDQRERESCDDPGGDSDDDLHGQAPRSVEVATSAIGPAVRITESRSVRRRAPPGARPQGRPYLGVSLRRLRLEGIMESGFEESAISEKTQFAGKMSGEA